MIYDYTLWSIVGECVLVSVVNLILMFRDLRRLKKIRMESKKYYPAHTWDETPAAGPFKN